MLQLFGKVGCKRKDFEAARFDRPMRDQIHFLSDAPFDAWVLIFGSSRKCLSEDSYRDFYPESSRLKKRAIAKIEKSLNPGVKRFTRHLQETFVIVVNYVYISIWPVLFLFFYF